MSDQQIYVNVPKHTSRTIYFIPYMYIYCMMSLKTIYKQLAITCGYGTLLHIQHICTFIVQVHPFILQSIHNNKGTFVTSYFKHTCTLYLALILIYPVIPMIQWVCILAKAFSTLYVNCLLCLC